MVENNYHLLLRKLDEFTRKFYLNKIIRGSLFTTAILVSCYLLFSYLEYNFYFSTFVRKILFYSFVLGGITLIYIWIIDPSLKYYKLGKIIDYKTAAKIIGAHFSNVQDKLLNILQLKENPSSASSRELIEASINQKIEKNKARTLCSRC